MTNGKDLLTIKEQLKEKTNELVSKDKELFDNLSKPEISHIKKERAKKFKGENHGLLRDTVIERCEESFKDSEFKGTKEMANDIIRVGHVMFFGGVHHRFQGLDKETAMNLLEHNNSAVLWYIDAFDNLDEEVALESLGYYTDPRKEFDMIVNNIDKFKGLKLDKAFALKLIEDTKASCFSANIDRFDSTGFDKDFALKLLTAKQKIHSHHNFTSDIIKNIDKFEGLRADADFANKIIDANESSYVVANPEKFEGFSLNKDIALKLIERKQFRLLLTNLKKFTGLDKDLAFKIIESCDQGDLKDGRGYEYPNLGCLIIDNVDVFSELEANEELAIWMLDHERDLVFGQTIGKFQGLGKISALKYLKSYGAMRFMEKKGRYFKGMDRDVAVALMNSDLHYSDDVLDNLYKFENTTPNKVAHYIKDKKDQYFNAKNITNKLNKYIGLDAEIKTWLINQGHQKEVDEHPMAFAG